MKHNNIISGALFFGCALTILGYDYYATNQSKPTETPVLGASYKPLKIELPKVLGPSVICFEPGDTFNELLSDNGLNAKQIAQIEKALKSTLGPVSFKAGQEFTLHVEDADLKLLSFRNQEFDIVITPNNKGKYSIEKKVIPLKRDLIFTSGSIDGSFTSSIKGSGLPSKLVHVASKNLGYVVNFQHAVAKGDTYKFLYEVFRDEKGNVVKSGDILYIHLAAKGKTYELYGYAPDGKKMHYFNHKGEGVARGLLSTPLGSGRIKVTSGFNLKGRVHPIKGFCRAHTGVDYGASYGTPVIASGDAVVIQAGYSGDYGNCITLQHNNGYKTRYAHLSKIKVKTGQPVKQRQVIGNVGSTGLSTGPHLHYELIVNNQPVNPLSFKQTAIQKLSGKDLSKFHSSLHTVKQELKDNDVPVVTVSQTNT